MLKTLIATLIATAPAPPSYPLKEFHYNPATNPAFSDFIGRYDVYPQPVVETHNKKLSEDLIDDINGDINDMFYKRENNPYIMGGYWQTPRETEDIKTGDCEDYAVMKWHILKAYGVPEKNMTFMIGRHKRLNMQHAILRVTFNNKYYYLDNTTWYMKEPQLDQSQAISYINRFKYTIRY